MIMLESSCPCFTLVSACLILQAEELGLAELPWTRGHVQPPAMGLMPEAHTALSPPQGGWKKWVLRINTAMTHRGYRAGTEHSEARFFLFWKGAMWVQKQHWKRPFRMGSKKPWQLRRFSHFHASLFKGTRFKLRQRCISKSQYHFPH